MPALKGLMSTAAVDFYHLVAQLHDSSGVMTSSGTEYYDVEYCINCVLPACKARA